MIEVTEKTREAFFHSQLGHTESVLFERECSEGCYEGYTENYTPVRAACSRNLSGEILPVRLSEIREDACFGILMEPSAV